MLRVNHDGQYVCAICGKPFAGVRPFSTHISKVHHIDSKAYYDTYAKDAGEGICPVCGKPTKFRSMAEGYKVCCSHACSGKHFSSDVEKVKARQAKIEATSMAKFGVKNGGGSKQALEKAQKTNLAKRGVQWVMQDKKVVRTSQDTCMAKYNATTYVHSVEGTERVNATVMSKFNRKNYFSGPEGHALAREGMLAKHGVDNPMKSPDILSRKIANEKAKYNGKFFVQTDEFKQESKDTQFAEYGTWYSASKEGRARYQEIMMHQHDVPEYFQSEDFRIKNAATLKAKYNVDNYAKTAMWRPQVEATSLKKWGVRHYAQSQEARQDAIDKYNGILNKWNCRLLTLITKQRIRYCCDNCGAECTEQAQFILWRDGHVITPCTNCYQKNSSVSVEETELTDYIKSLGFEVTHYDRDFIGTYGADIVIESKKVIIEYDGLHWHSELYHDSKYHIQKTMMAKKLGYRLVHVFSDEWVYKTDIVKSRIAHILGNQPEVRLYARKCHVGPVEWRQESAFLEHNHIQGPIHSTWCYGLFASSNDLVAMMSFGPSRFENDTIEMLRYCSRRDGSVVGGAGRLLHAFIHEHPEICKIVSYADARWSTEDAFYSKLGFSLDAISEPGYYIVDGDIRRSRFQFQRHKIAGPGDEGKTEHEITLERGLYRIYDCGQYKYVWHRNKEPQ